MFERVDRIKKKRMHETVERRKIAKELEQEEEREWEENRDKRVKGWRKFVANSKGGKKRGRFEFKPPKVRADQRPGNKSGLNNDYKKEWK